MNRKIIFGVQIFLLYFAILYIAVGVLPLLLNLPYNPNYLTPLVIGVILFLLSLLTKKILGRFK